MIRGENQSELFWHNARADSAYVRQPCSRVNEHIVEVLHEHLPEMRKKASLVMVKVFPVEPPHLLPVIFRAGGVIERSATSRHPETVGRAAGSSDVRL